ncbi:hypothetical protein AAC387_Pa03g3094 [Persea americana]
MGVVSQDRCDRYANCGAYGSCDPNRVDECECLRGFEPKTPSDWELRVWLGGCVRRRSLDCDGKGDGFLRLEHVKVPDTSRSRVEPGLSLEGCKEECLKKCSCTAYASADITEGGRDFGMARIFGQNQAQGNTNTVVGTYGYMSPEYAMDGHFSVKSDAFSFGVILLEIISGKRNNHYKDCRSMNLIGHVWEMWKEGRVLELVDPSVNIFSYESEVLRCIQVGLLCVQEKAKDRPNMSSVVFMLSNETTMISPKQPAFCFGKGNWSDYLQLPTNGIVSCSTNEVTMTQMEAR